MKLKGARIVERRKQITAVCVEIEFLEGRALPSALVITPPASIVSSDQYIVAVPAAAANGGLLVAAAHSHGVVQVQGR
jgi:hypothetical protein